MISEYGKHLSEKLGLKFSKIEKLVPNFNHRKEYVLHIRNLQLYISLGMRCSKIHRILEFTQSRWLAPYIEKNTQLRARATSGFEKDLFNSPNNSVFGKTMENVRQRHDIRLVTDPVQGLKLASRPTFQSFKIVNENLTVVKLMKSRILMNKSTYIGMSVLNLSKLLMYDFHYNIIKTTVRKQFQITLHRHRQSSVQYRNSEHLRRYATGYRPVRYIRLSSRP